MHMQRGTSLRLEQATKRECLALTKTNNRLAESTKYNAVGVEATGNGRQQNKPPQRCDQECVSLV